MLRNNNIYGNKKIAIAVHYSFTGFVDHIQEFLLSRKVKRLLVIRHPLHKETWKSRSYYELFEDGNFIKKESTSMSYKIDILNHLKSTIFNILWVIKQKDKWDLYLGIDGLNAIAGVVLRKLGIVKKVVFYSVDFVPKRFVNKFTNYIYHLVDKLAIIYADEVWVLSPRMIDGRREYLKIDRKYDKKQILFPEGVWLERMERETFEKINKHTAVFLGYLTERMGAQLVIEAIPKISKEIPDFRYIVIGKGPYKKELEKLARKMDVAKYVDILGYVEDHKEIEKILSKSALGIATYLKKDESGLTYYADPAKTKIYLGASLPVIVTDTFYNAYDYEKAGAGLVVEDTSESVSSGIVSILKDEKTLWKYREAAYEFAKQFNNPTLFHKALKRVL